MASSKETDFLDIVQGYLDRGEVYKKADEFVTKLALCPRCRGGRVQTQTLKETLFRMVALVKEKLLEQRNKKVLQAWLKTVAKALDTFEVISRDWISENVWKLPDLPKPKEQDYDPTKGRRDIRFYPETESGLLDVTEQEEMEVELDYIDEDKLLSMSPAKTSSARSPRKSPRSSKLQTQQESVSPTKSSVGSPRKSPRFSKGEPLQESSRKETPSSSRALDSAVSCSPPRKALRIATDVTKVIKDSSQSKGSGKVIRTSSKDSGSGGTKKDTQPKSAKPIKSADPREWRKQGDGRACSSSSSTVARPSGDKDKTVLTKAGRTVQIREQDSRKRGTSSQTEELVISTTFLEKTKTADAIQQVRQRVEERRDTQVKKPEKSTVRCWVPGCGGAAKYMKAHAFFDHLPSIFDERFDPSDEKLMRIRRNALKQAGRWLLGRPVELDELVAFVIVQKLLSQTDNTEITKRQERAMQEFCKFLQEPIPDKFILEPCNSVGVLLHWKALLLIAASLTEEERGYWRTTFQAPEDTESQEVQPAQQKVFPEAFDSHFHLDRTLREMFLPAHGTLDDILQQAPVDENKKISLVGAVAIYCDPRTYPLVNYLDRMPKHISVGIGFHPKQAKSSAARINDEVQQLRRLLRHPRVVAFGEVGLDHSEPLKYWASQIELLEKVLPFLEDRHVLVIHCRGMQGDCGTEAFLLLLHHLKKYVRPHQQLHLHCFTGNCYVIERWLEVFPRTYFGFTNKVRSFNRHQIAALCKIDENRLLLESDAPYFPIEGITVSSPSHLYVLAETVAVHRQLTAERVLEITVANARHLYQGQQ